MNERTSKILRLLAISTLNLCGAVMIIRAAFITSKPLGLFICGMLLLLLAFGLEKQWGQQ